MPDNLVRLSLYLTWRRRPACPWTWSAPPASSSPPPRCRSVAWPRRYLQLSSRTPTVVRTGTGNRPFFSNANTSVVDPGHFGTDPYNWDTGPDSDPAPNPALFVSGFQDFNKKLVFFLSFFLFTFEGTVHLHHSSKIKCHKEVTKK